MHIGETGVGGLVGMLGSEPKAGDEGKGSPSTDLVFLPLSFLFPFSL